MFERHDARLPHASLSTSSTGAATPVTIIARPNFNLDVSGAVFEDNAFRSNSSNFQAQHARKYPHGAMLTWQSCTEKVGANYSMSRHLPAADAIRTNGRSFRRKQRCRLSPATAGIVKSLERHTPCLQKRSTEANPREISTAVTTSDDPNMSDTTTRARSVRRGTHRVQKLALHHEALQVENHEFPRSASLLITCGCRCETSRFGLLPAPTSGESARRYPTGETILRMLQAWS